MNHFERQKKEHSGPHPDGSNPQRPYWKRMHHSAFFWVALVFIFIAMGIFILTDGFLFRPRNAAPEPSPSTR